MNDKKTNEYEYEYEDKEDKNNKHITQPYIKEIKQEPPRKNDNQKHMAIIIGGFIAVLGILSLGGQIFNIGSFGFSIQNILPSMLTTVLGAVLLLGYVNKRSTISLIMGGYLLYFGFFKISIVQFCMRNILHISTNSLMFAGIFVVPGLIFLILYYDKHKRFLLIPGNFLLWFGIYMIINSIFRGRDVFILCMGISLLASYLMGDNKGNKTLLYFGSGIIFLGILSFLRIHLVGEFIRHFRYLISIGVVILGLLVVYKTLKDDAD